MQHIQDKEFDQLFKDKFETAEVQPSANLWGGIAAKLPTARKRRSPVYWMAAAVAMVVAGTGLLLMPETETIRLQGKTGTTGQTALAVVSRPLEVKADEDLVPDAQSSGTQLVLAPRLKPDAESEINTKTMQPKGVKPHLVHVPAERESAPAQPFEDTRPVVITHTVLASAVAAENKADAVSDANEMPHKGIRNVGDVVNFVVNQIDKREKKIIQFDTDEDNSSVVAFNIGFIKFNKRSDK